MSGKKKYDPTPVSELEQERLAQETIRSLRERGFDPDLECPPIQHGDPAKMAAERAQLPWWKR